jgi:SAM-dependent methyltransferase
LGLAKEAGPGDWGWGVTRELLRAERLPVLQNRTYATASAALASAVGNLVLMQSSKTGLVFNSAFDPRLLRYDSDYQNEQACSPAFRRHLSDVETRIAPYFKGKRLIEVGCGKGYFLEYLQSMGYAVTGIDPAYDGDNIDIIRAPFEAGLGLSADAIVLRHVLEHIPDPMSFLAELGQVNRGRGMIYVEVPCFDWILAHRAWFDIYYEHVNYFRASDLQQMFGRVLDCGTVFGGQYLYVIADLASLRLPRFDSTRQVEMPADFMSGIETAAAAIRRNGNRRNAVWGAASKGVIFSVYLQRAGISLDEAIDINPAKQGRFLACTGLRVSSPVDADTRLSDKDNVFVMNSNYLDEIVAQSRQRFTYLTVDHERFCQ